MKLLFFALIYFFAAPLIGALLSGIDRKISARMQGRVGPPVLQPIFDVIKLFNKENLVVRRSQNFYVTYYMILIIFTGGLFFTGENILLMIFALTLASVFFVLAGYKASSPYSFIGAQRELLQIMAYEPALIFVAVGLYMVTGTFEVGEIMNSHRMLIFWLPGVFASFAYILAIKFRKSPFDFSTSHHAHQEIVKGITTEFSGRALAMIEIAHWYETVLVLGIVSLFFARNLGTAVSAALLVYLAVIFVDNACARSKWQFALVSAWLITLVLAVSNIIMWFFLKGKINNVG